MKTVRLHWPSLLVIAVMAIASCGCTAQIIGDAARTSAASFFNSIFSSAVNAAILTK